MTEIVLDAQNKIDEKLRDSEINKEIEIKEAKNQKKQSDLIEMARKVAENHEKLRKEFEEKIYKIKKKKEAEEAAKKAEEKLRKIQLLRNMLLKRVNSIHRYSKEECLELNKLIKEAKKELLENNLEQVGDAPFSYEGFTWIETIIKKYLEVSENHMLKSKLHWHTQPSDYTTFFFLLPQNTPKKPYLPLHR